MDCRILYFFPHDVVDTLRIYFRNRFITRTHLIDTKLPTGSWHETDDRLLHGMFELLVDFIEIEKAGMHEWSKNKQGFSLSLKKRSADNGIAYLKWEMGLLRENMDGTEEVVLSKQAEMAAEQWFLYNWWKNERPNRSDILNDTGYTQFNDEVYTDDVWLDKQLTNQQREKLKEIMQVVYEMEEAREQEDEEMLIRLIKIRRSLWT